MNTKTKITTIIILILLSLTSCQNQPPRPDFFEGYRQAESGIYYQFHTRSHSGESIQVGDIILAVVNFYWCEERIITELMDISTLWIVDPPLFSGDLSEGFLMMHVGDSASFILPADSVIKHWDVHRGYMHHLCDYFRVTIRVDSIYEAFDSIAYKEEREMLREDERARAEERRIIDSIAQIERQARISEERIMLQNHVRGLNINVNPNVDGVYVVVDRRGSGRRIREGRTVVFDYTARSLDGRILDSSCEDIAYYAGVAFPMRHYKPQEIRVGERQWMLGLDNALIRQRAGSKLRLFMPYSAIENPNIRLVSGFQPIILEVEILEVR